MYLATLASGKKVALTSGTSDRTNATVSPDGQKLVFAESSGDYDVVSVDLATVAARRLISTQLNEYMPAWAGRQPVMAYITNRNGPDEIWLHSSAGERPVVTGRYFPPGTTSGSWRRRSLPKVTA